jgi:glycosyltransferase involved in cell wall biosynthesis
VVVGSATAPVQEVIESGVNGLLVDYFDAGALAATIAAVLADPQGHRPLGLAARATVVERYDLQRVCLPQQLKLVDAVANRRRP